MNSTTTPPARELCLPRQLILVRHGQTEWNVERRLQGQLDSALTSLGEVQAEAVGKTLRRHFGEAWSPLFRSSPLGRASATAAIVAQHLELVDGAVHDARLAEVSFGAFEGLTEDEVVEKYPDLGAQRRQDKWNFVHPGGESYASTTLRVKDFLADLADQKQVLVVAHSGIGRVIRGCFLRLEGHDLAYMRHPQNEIYVLTEGSSITLETGAP